MRRHLLKKIQHAIVRPPGKSMVEGITTSKLGKVDYKLALNQHQEYCDALRSCGLSVTTLPIANDFPDSCFVEDVAVCAGDVAIMTRPGDSRRSGEVELIRSEIETHFRSIFEIQAPGTLDGGDVMAVGSHYYIGLSHRTNLQGATELMEYLKEAGYTSSGIRVSNYLHLKTGMTFLENNIVLMTPEMKDCLEFQHMDRIVVHPDDVAAANCIWINDTILVPRGFPAVERELQSRGCVVYPVDTSEIQ